MPRWSRARWPHGTTTVWQHEGVSQEPADPTASSAPSDGTPPTIPSPAADVQPGAGEESPPAAEPAAVETPTADATPVADAPGIPPAAIESSPAPADRPAAAETSAAILAAVVAEPEAAPEPPLVSYVAPVAQGSRGPWRTIGGVLLLLLLAAAVGFGASFLVPGFVDVAAPSGAAAATTPAPSATAAPTLSPSASAGPGRSPTPSSSSGGSATPRSSSTIYVVQKGDILSAIAARFGVTVQAIVAANGLANPNHIEPGQRLIIPPP